MAITGSICVLSFVVAPTYALTPSPTPSAISSVPTSPTPPHKVDKRSGSPRPISSVDANRKLAREAARATYQAALSEAQNGRDLAFADANATLLQSLQTAGKDRVARQAARDTYKKAATGIITAYKQSIASAQQIYKAVLLAISGK